MIQTVENKKISVIMGIYNCEDTLQEAIDCILQQTYTDWELILCDDGSRDGTYALAESICNRYPEKIILLKNETNRGLNFTLNRCLEHASGSYIARMDGDDRCRADRFALELAALESEPELAIVSTDMEFFDENGIWGRTHYMTYPGKTDFARCNPFCHAPCLVKKEAYDAVGGYSVENRLLRVEDYHLWIKMYAAGYRGKNLPQPLYQMRDDRNAYARRRFRYRLNEAYVKLLAVKLLKLPLWMAVYALRPVITGLMPQFLYDFLHKRRLSKEN